MFENGSQYCTATFIKICTTLLTADEQNLSISVQGKS